MSDKFNINLCIICQENRKDLKLTSTENGRLKIKSSAEAFRDDVYHRLKLLNDGDIFHYHVTSNCYKKYTRNCCAQNTEPAIPNPSEKHNLDDKNDGDDDDNGDDDDVDNVESSRQSKRLRMSIDFTLNDDECIVCAMKKFQGDSKLHSLGKERAKTLFEASRYFNDDVFLRTAIFSTDKDFICSNFKYHSTCLRNYEQKYERSRSESYVIC